MQPTLCSVAKRMASEHFGIRLDLSPRSVRSVEKILGAIRKEHLKSRSSAGFDGIALEYAAYIVEVIQGHFGPALWQRDCPRQGVDTFPLYWRNQILYPYAWCQKRIYDGAADDVWSRFSGAVLGKSSRRWWQPFGRRAADLPAPSTPRLADELPASVSVAAGPDLERRLRPHRGDRRTLPIRHDQREAQGARAAGPDAQSHEPLREPVDGVVLTPEQAPEVIEVLDVLGDSRLALAEAAMVDEERQRDDAAAAELEPWNLSACATDAAAGKERVAAPGEARAFGTGEQRGPHRQPAGSARRAPATGR